MIETKRSKYDVELHMDQDDVHTRTVRLVGPDHVVLECGCDTGYVSKALTEIGCRVTGIEANPVAAEAAREFCEEVVVSDLDGFDFERELAPRTFDVVVFGDVLEHLKDPWAVLRRVRAVLKPDGRVVASIPNIAERNVVLNLLLGEFEYRKLGLLDETHLRFFTAQSVRNLFEATGYVIARIDRVQNEIVEREVPLDLSRVPLEVQEFAARQNPDYRTIQFLVEAYPSTEAGTIAAVRAQLARVEAEATELRRSLARSGEERRELEARITQQLEPRIAELEGRVVDQQRLWAREMQGVEERAEQRLAEQREALDRELHAVAESEALWRERAEETERRYTALTRRLIVRVLRRVRWMFG